MSKSAATVEAEQQALTNWLEGGSVVLDRDLCAVAWVAFEPEFGWVVYPFGPFRRCIPQEGEAYTSGNYGITYGYKLPADPWEWR